MRLIQSGSLRRNVQAGFTLIELIVVIVILGILAATAIPKFANVGADARMSKMQAARAAIQSASALYHGRWLAAGSPSTPATTTYDSNVVVDNTTGYPTNAGMLNAAGGFADYDTSTFVSAGTLMSDTGHSGCVITYTEGTGAVSTAPSGVDCQ